MAVNPVAGMPMPGGTKGAQGSPSSELQRLEKQRDSLKQEYKPAAAKPGGRGCSKTEGRRTRKTD